MKKKYDPVLEDDMYWRYQDLAESWTDFVSELMRFDKDSEEFRSSVAHLARKVYERGYDDAKKHYNIDEDEPVSEDGLIIEQRKPFWN